MKLTDEQVKNVIDNLKNVPAGLLHGSTIDLLQDMAEDLLSLREKERWIPVSKRLPEFNVPVLAALKHVSGKRAIAYLEHVNESDCSWVTEDDSSELHWNYDVTHWRPISPPQEGS